MDGELKLNEMVSARRPLGEARAALDDWLQGTRFVSSGAQPRLATANLDLTSNVSVAAAMVATAASNGSWL